MNYLSLIQFVLIMEKLYLLINFIPCLPVVGNDVIGLMAGEGLLHACVSNLYLSMENA